MSIKIELIAAPGCGKCVAAQQQLRAIATAVFGNNEVVWREVNVLKEFDYALSLGVLSMPAIAVNGELKFSSLPTPEQFRIMLTNLESC
ncbi:thioredoxin family protein [Undibacterium griseum]|uniref:Thioredoxin family protein n=1 Tax=Undibacterium griseum TaxID=2762295 RepID=A0ABR6YJQ0_9BURK|nr:thioredoxin family protein [Undibacterium griseum]MBC3884078.1 thioredoxin family protein [Undibacterium griseum]